jgi:hypothetical protein
VLFSERRKGDSYAITYDVAPCFSSGQRCDHGNAQRGIRQPAAERKDARVLVVIMSVRRGWTGSWHMQLRPS